MAKGDLARAAKPQSPIPENKLRGRLTDVV
jgi:hypothetical protein